MTETTLNEVAREQYPTTYQENLTEIEPSSKPLKTVDDAYQALQERKESIPEKSGKKIARAVKKSEIESSDYPEETPEQVFTHEDFETLQLVQQEFANVHSDIALWRAGVAQIPEIEKTDKARAEALKQESREVQKYLQKRWDDLSSLAQELQSKQWKVYLSKEQKKLNRALPGLDIGELRSYLTEAGFTKHEIDTAADHRLIVLAEKARQWDEHISGSGTKPKPRVRAVKNSGSKQRPRNNVEKLEARFKKSGKIDDALEYMRAKKEARA